jgi:parallel beta-helix repeat protein
VTISGNRISRNWYGIFLEGRVSVTLRGNQFRRVHTQVKVVL